MIDFAKARILVTGGAGFIGSALVWELNRRGCERIVIADFLESSEKWRNLAPLTFEDYLDAGDLMGRMEAKSLGRFDLILHMGACSSTTERDASYLARNNYQFTKDTIASILTSGLLGDVYIGLDPGGDPQMLADGGTVSKTQSGIVLEKLIGQFLFDKAAQQGGAAK